MADFTLYSLIESGNAYKPALLLQLSGCDWKARWVDLFNGENKTPEYLAINEMGEVPVLIDHTEDDLAISQSGVMLYHIAGKTGKFGPKTPAEEREILRWILWDNHKLTGYVSAFRVLNKFMNKGDSQEAEFIRGRMNAALKILNRHLETNDWVAFDRPTIADISLCGYLFWPDHFRTDWADYPAIPEWLDRIKSLDNWAAPEDLLPSGPQAD